MSFWTVKLMGQDAISYLILRLTQARSRQAVLAELLEGVPGLRGVALWWRSDDLHTLLLSQGSEVDPLPRLPLLVEARYSVSLTPGVELPPELLAVLGLVLAHLDAVQTIDRMTPQLSQLQQAAQIDVLTGLWNRRAFDEDLDAIDISGTSFAIVLIDLDGFKEVNDRHGHALGDALLRGYATWLSRIVGSWGRIYRLGGDEYVILVTGYPGRRSDFLAWAHERLQVPFVDGVSASIGVAWRDESWRVADVLRLADSRMYQDKRERRQPAVPPA